MLNRLMMEKWVKWLRLGIIGSGIFLMHVTANAKEKPISLQEAIDMALKENLDIQIAGNKKKESLLENRIESVNLWFPTVAYRLGQQNSWRKEGANFSFQSDPITLTWKLDLFNNIFATKIRRKNNIVVNLTAVKSVSEILQRVVTSYYALALAQKRWELSNTLVRVAAAKLKIDEEKFRLGIVSKIDYFNAELTLKKAKLTWLEDQEALKKNRRHLNIIFGKPLHTTILVQSDTSVQPMWDITAITKEKVVDLETVIQENKVAIAATKLTQTKVSYPLSCLSISSNFCLNDGYTYDFKNSPVGKQQPFSHTNETFSKSLNIGISLNLDIAGLLLLPARIQKARMHLNHEKLNLTKDKLTAEAHLEDKRGAYDHLIASHKIVKEKLQLQKQKLVVAKEQYRLHQIQLLELREAEKEVQQAEYDVIDAVFKVKKAEFELYHLMGGRDFFVQNIKKGSTIKLR
ncbi:TolC family protein [Candidatus Cardinium hertigii]|uniref:TolC family protein n=1 Tax=Candidatus Cardinium hertigii TaxID=247481 RepID=UPI001C84DFE5|nr:TolC family protein [Candidatus Cardinium hertigii]